MPEYGVICYSTKVKMPIQCHSYELNCEDKGRTTFVCKRGLAEWAKSKLAMEKFSDEEGVACPNNKCNHKLTDSDLMKYCGPKMFEEVNQVYTDIYISNTDDMRRCPRENCDNAGSIELKSGRDKLECDKGGLQWREKAQVSYLRRISNSLFGGIRDLDLYSYLNEVFTAYPCPRCEEVIWKNGGCTHMTGSKGKYEFGWDGMGHFPGYEHKDPMPGGLRSLLSFWITLLSVFIFYSKLSSEVSFIQTIHYFIWRIIKFIFFYIILPNFGAFVLPAIIFLLIGNILYTIKVWSYGDEKAQRGAYIILGVVAIPINCYLAYTSYYSKTYNFIHHSFIYELCIILYLAIFVVAGYIIYQLMKFLFRVCRILLRFTGRMIRRKGYLLIYAGKVTFSWLNYFRKFLYMTKRESSRHKVAKSIQRNKKGQKYSKSANRIKPKNRKIH